MTRQYQRSEDGERRRVEAVKASQAARRRQPIDRGDGTFAVPLTRGKEAIIDASDVVLVGRYCWKAMVFSSEHVYAGRTLNGDGQHCLMHRHILDAPIGFEVDHINGNTLDNRRCNLRLATSTQNGCNTRRRSDNTSGYKGVCWDAQQSKWKARVQVNGRQYHAGFHDTAEAAYAARCALAERLHGEFARHE